MAEMKDHVNILFYVSLRKALEEQFGSTRGKGGRKSMHTTAALLHYMLMPADQRQEVLNKLHQAIALAEGGTGSIWDNARKVWGVPAEPPPVEVRSKKTQH